MHFIECKVFVDFNSKRISPWMQHFSLSAMPLRPKQSFLRTTVFLSSVKWRQKGQTQLTLQIMLEMTSQRPFFTLDMMLLVAPLVRGAAVVMIIWNGEMECVVWYLLMIFPSIWGQQLSCFHSFCCTLIIPIRFPGHVKLYPRSIMLTDIHTWYHKYDRFSSRNNERRLHQWDLHVWILGITSLR